MQLPDKHTLVQDIATLEKLYGAPIPTALTKVMTAVTPCYRQWIQACRFLILSTVGPDGTDASPRGDEGPVVQIADETTLLLPDWRGNNRLDSLRNIVRDGRVSLLLIIPGSDNVVRVNGTAVLTSDNNITKQFSKNGKAPVTVIVITIQELYWQCAKALMRSALWHGEDVSQHVPTAGQFIKEMDSGFDADQYDKGYPDYAKDRMW